MIIFLSLESCLQVTRVRCLWIKLLLVPKGSLSSERGAVGWTCPAGSAR